MCIQGCILGGRWLQIGALVYLYRPLKMKRRSLHPHNAHQIVTLVVVVHGTLQRCVLVVKQRLKLEAIVLFLSLNAPLEQEVAIQVFVANRWRGILDITFRKPGFVTMTRLQHTSCQMSASCLP